MKVKSIEKKVVLKTSKRWVSVVCDPALTIKQIMDQLDGSKEFGSLKMHAYRIMNGPDNERQWRWPNGELMGQKAHGMIHHTEKIVENAGISGMIDQRFTMWREKACKGLGLTIKDAVQSKEKAVKPDLKVAGSGTVKLSFEAKSYAELDALVREYLNGRK